MSGRWSGACKRQCEVGSGDWRCGMRLRVVVCCEVVSGGGFVR